MLCTNIQMTYVESISSHVQTKTMENIIIYSKQLNIKLGCNILQLVIL